MNRCYIISREQITRQLKIQLANSTEQAKRICRFCLFDIR